jgi:hypothetical protein
MLTGKSGSGRWIRGYRRVPGSVPLFCFPHAGGAASYFHPWSASLAPGIEVLAVQYPGREDRAVEPCVTNIPDLADQIHAALRPSLPGTFVNGQVAVPAGGRVKVPTPRVDQVLFRVVPFLALASRMR